MYYMYAHLKGGVKYVDAHPGFCQICRYASEGRHRICIYLFYFIHSLYIAQKGGVKYVDAHQKGGVKYVECRCTSEGRRRKFENVDAHQKGGVRYALILNQTQNFFFAEFGTNTNEHKYIKITNI